MLTFQEVEELIEKREKLPGKNTAEERIAYQILYSMKDLLGRRLILKQQGEEMRRDAYHLFHDIRRTRDGLQKAYARQLDSLKRAEEKTAELMKAIAPEADREELLYKAVELISLYEGQETDVYRKTIQRKLQPDTVVLLTPMDIPRRVR